MRIADASADCRIALETICCSCCDVSVHCAASIVSPRNSTRVGWNLGAACDIIDMMRGLPVLGPAWLLSDDTEPARNRAASLE